MATYTQQLILELLVKSDQLNKGLKEVGQSTKQASQQLDSFKQAASSALSFAASVGIGAGIVKTIKDTTTAYGEFINQQATAQQVFGDSYGELEKTMSKSVDLFGQSQTQFLKSTTLIAGLGKAAGIANEDLVPFSTAINQIGADLAAAFNTSTVDAISAIQSGFSGSSIEPLRKYNIVLSDTILKQEYLALTGEKVTGVLTQQQRMAAFLSKLYQESADFTGQWNRESDQFLGTMQRLQATMGDAAVSIGQSFEPAITAAANAIIPLVEGAADLNTAMGGLPVTLGLATAALIALRGPLALASQGIIALTTATSAMTLKSGVGNALKSLGTSIAAIGPAGVIAGAGLAGFAFYSAGATKKANELSGAMKAVAEQAQKVDLENFQKVLKDITNEDTSFLEDVMSAGFFVVDDAADGAARSLEGIIEKLTDMGEEAPRVVASLLAIYESGGPMAQQMREAGITTQMLRESLNNAARESENFAVIQAQIDTILEGTAGQVARNEEAYDSFADSLDGIAKAAQDAADAVDDLVDDAIAGFTDQNNVELTRLQIAESIAAWAETYNTALAEGETPLQRQITNLENLNAIYAAVNDNLDEQIAAQERASGTPLVGEDRIDFINDFIAQAKTDFPIIAGQLDALQQDLAANPIQLAVEASTTGATDAIEQLFADSDGLQVVLDMLVDSGVAEETVNGFIASMGADKVVEIATKAVTSIAEDDISLLEDEDYVAEVTAKALTDAAVDDFEEITEGDYNASIKLNANTTAFIEEMNAVRRAQSQSPIYIPVKPTTGAGSSGATSGGGVPDEPEGFSTAPATVGEVSMQQLAEGATPTAADASFQSSMTRKVSAVRAQQPITQTTNVYVTMPSADPSATIRSIQRWSRQNGALPIMRGH